MMLQIHFSSSNVLVSWLTVIGIGLQQERGDGNITGSEQSMAIAVRAVNGNSSAAVTAVQRSYSNVEESVQCREVTAMQRSQCSVEMPEGLVQTLQMSWFSCVDDKKLSNFSGSWKAHLLRKARRSLKHNWSIGHACVLVGLVVGIVDVLDVRLLSVKAKSEVKAKA